VATNCPQCRAEFENILVLNDAGDVVREELVEKKEPPAGMCAYGVLANTYCTAIGWASASLASLLD
jgi:hypothetical protein